jgi:hypothetical protein
MIFSTGSTDSANLVAIHSGTRLVGPVDGADLNIASAQHRR